MSYNGSGVYTAPGSSFPAVTGTVIDSSKYNAVINDIATGLTTAITKDGQTTITANLPMATYRHTGVGDATALTDYASANQVVDNTLTYGGASAAGTDTYAITLPISPGAYVVGNRFQFLTDVANTGACTLNVNTLGAKSIKLANGSDPDSNCILASSIVDVQYDGTNFILLNPWLGGATETVTGQKTFNEDIIMQAGNGMDFSANTGAAGETSGVLDWYEEGTFTPDVMDSSFSAAESQTYTFRYGYYTRIGRIVFYQINIGMSSLGSLTTSDSVYIGSLPFTAVSITSTTAGYGIVSTASSLSGASGTAKTARVVTGQTYMQLYEWGGSTGFTTFSLGELTASGQLNVHGHYMV